VCRRRVVPELFSFCSLLSVWNELAVHFDIWLLSRRLGRIDPLKLRFRSCNRRLCRLNAGLSSRAGSMAGGECAGEGTLWWKRGRGRSEFECWLFSSLYMDLLGDGCACAIMRGMMSSRPSPCSARRRRGVQAGWSSSPNEKRWQPSTTGSISQSAIRLGTFHACQECLTVDGAIGASQWIDNVAINAIAWEYRREDAAE
jgi:hypothetical protein